MPSPLAEAFLMGILNGCYETPSKIERMTEKVEERVGNGLSRIVTAPHLECYSNHTSCRASITNRYLNYTHTIPYAIYVSGHKTQKTFIDYIKFSSGK